MTEQDVAEANLILFGTGSNNSLMEKVVKEFEGVFLTKLLVEERTKSADRNKADFQDITASWIHPNPLNPAKYVVVNSGPTFREAHDRTNSLQNPKLPDWVIFDLSDPPNAERAAQVNNAGFFDESWELK